MLFKSQYIRRSRLVLLAVTLWPVGADGAPPESHSANQPQPTVKKTNWRALHTFYERATWPAPVLDDGNLSKWQNFIRPTEKELKWKQIRWHKSLSVAATEARRLHRPILLWTMNGHPCGET